MADALVRTCGACDHGAFHNGGVYCMEFHEDITDETVADTCAMYDGDEPLVRNEALLSEPTALELSAPRLSTHVEPQEGAQPGAQPGAPEPTDSCADRFLERERSFSVQVDVAYFGRPEHGDQMVAKVGALVRMHLTRNAEVTRLT